MSSYKVLIMFITSEVRRIFVCVRDTCYLITEFRPLETALLENKDGRTVLPYTWQNLVPHFFSQCKSYEEFHFLQHGAQPRVALQVCVCVWLESHFSDRWTRRGGPTEGPFMWFAFCGISSKRKVNCQNQE